MSLPRRVFNKLLLSLDPSKAKEILWTSLEQVLRKTYRLGGEGESACWEMIQNYFHEPAIIDVGANTGQMSTFYINLFPGSRVYAIEPIKEFFDKINDENFSKFNIALSDKRQSINIYQYGGGAKAARKKSKKQSIVHQISTLPGDDFVLEYNVGKVDIIKIDVDGFDYEVLLGFERVLRSDRPCVQFELSKFWIELGYTLQQAKKFMESIDYVLYEMTDSGFRPLQVNLPEALLVTINILAVPSESDISHSIDTNYTKD